LHLDFPVFALETLPNAGNPSGIGEINTDLRIGNYLISPGDFIFADESGVVVIQQSIFSDVILETLKIKIKEFKIIKQLKNGKSLSEIVGLK
jgi:3-hexulose-6-phosphate synthase